MLDTHEPTSGIEIPAAHKTGKKVSLILLLVVVALLGVAAFMAGRLMNNPAGGSPSSRLFGGSGGPMLSMSSKGGGGPEMSVELKMKPAKELPTTQPEANGMFTERKDNSIFIGTGNVGMTVMQGENGEVNADASYDGPVIEVVITQDTKIYHDITPIEPPESGASGTIEVQQEVELSSIEAIGEQSMLSVWGKKVGDRLIADVILFSTPFMVAVPAGR